MRIAVIGDSISSRNNGASAVSWPFLLDTMIKDCGVFGVELKNYSIPGLKWKTAHVPTPNWLIAGRFTPVSEVITQGADMVLVCLGANDRNNGNAIQDALDFKAALPSVPIHLIRQVMYDALDPTETVVTAAEQAAMDAVYAALNLPGFGLNLRKLYDCGYDYDRLHPTNTGKQWIAASVYRYLEPILSLTPITRNIHWLYEQKETNPAEFQKMLGVPV